MEYGYLIWIAVAAIVFGVLWRKGYLMQLAKYSSATRDELRKCTWPTKGELKGSTVVVLIVSLILSLFILGVDFVALQIVRRIM